MFDVGKLKLLWLVEEEDTFASASVAFIRAKDWTFPVYFSYGPSICAPPKKKILMLKLPMWLFWKQAFRKELYLDEIVKVGTCDGVSAVIRRETGNLSLCCVKTQQEEAVHKPGRGCSRNQICWHVLACIRKGCWHGVLCTGGCGMEKRRGETYHQNFWS